MSLRVLTWNLMHGRGVPSAGRDLLGDFAGALSSWEWDVALLQEVPPWWPAPLAAASGAEHRVVLTSRNALLPVRRAIATRWPDAIKSNGGGSNAILARAGVIDRHRILRLCRFPERRWVHGVRLQGMPGLGGAWFANLHATVHNADAALRDARLAGATALAWAGSGVPVVLGGDFNVRRLSVDSLLFAGGFDVDHVFARGLTAVGAPERLERGHLSDHAPVRVSLERAARS